MIKLRDTIIKQAVQQAQCSTYYQRVGAIIFKKKHTISKGFNQFRGARHLHKRFQRWSGSLHAEVAAILNAKTNLKGCDILIVRINNSNQFRLAKPCRHCLMYLDYVGIRKIYYSIKSYPYIIEVAD